jgi:hypothetical protein
MIEDNTTIIKTVENAEYEIERTYNLNKTINEIIEQDLIKTNK